MIFNYTNYLSLGSISNNEGNKINLTPVAIAEGHAFADREFGGIDRFISYEDVPCAVFSQPPVSIVGISKNSALEKGIKVTEYISEFNPLKNTITGKVEKTLMKLRDISYSVVGISNRYKLSINQPVNHKIEYHHFENKSFQNLMCGFLLRLNKSELFFNRFQKLLVIKKIEDCNF